MSRDDLLAALNAERYGTPHWFAQPPTVEAPDDSDTTTARRRRDLMSAAETYYAKEA